MSSSPPRELTSPPPDTPHNEEEEEDLLENMEKDYEERAELDTYDADDIDDTIISPMGISERRGVDELLNQRDIGRGGGRRNFIPHQLMDQDDDIPMAINNMMINDEYSMESQQQIGDNSEYDHLVNLEDFDGPLREWLDEDRVRREIKNRFKSFLTSFTDRSGNAVYPNKIKKMCQENRCSLSISYMYLSEFAAVLAIWLVEQPSIMLELFDSVAMDVAKISFPDYSSIHNVIHIRITNLPLTDELRDLRQLHLNSFVQVSGVITRRTSILPQLELVRFDCIKCGFTTSPIAQRRAGNDNNDKLIQPQSCPDCGSNGPFKISENRTIYRNYQKIILQESPSSVPAGRIPRSRDVILIDDLCDMVRPGEEICITGIYKNEFSIKTNMIQCFPVFGTIIEANNILKLDEERNDNITDSEKQYFVNTLSKIPDLENILLAECVAPSIYGHEYIKRSILYSLFGGESKQHSNKHRVRGDINILILGDPGTGKSQFLKYIQRIGYRCIYSTGKGASAVGLTASVHRDRMSGEWTLEGGALVLADNGICLIDEFDKMNEKDRVSIHEAMEQQTISVSKAGIIATLQARCAVIAAANPIRGRYDSSLTFIENVDLTDPILSRFDILAIVRDRVDVINDEKLAQFVVNNHIKYHPSSEPQQMDEQETEEPINSIGLTQEMLSKYIRFAKKTCKPKLDNIDRDKIAEFYSDLRQKSMSSPGGIPIAVRHIESILRLSEARAKLHLREYVRSDDVDMAIRVMLESFIKTQKKSIQLTLEKYFKLYLNYNHNTNHLLLHLLNKQIDDEIKWKQMDTQNTDLIEIPIKDFNDKIKSLSITNANLQTFLKSNKFKNNHFKYDKKRQVIQKYFA